MSSPRRVRVGVLGAGAWARAAHLPGFARDSRCEIVAIADTKRELAAEAAAEFAIPLVVRLAPRRSSPTTASTSSTCARRAARISSCRGRRSSRDVTCCARSRWRSTTATPGGPPSWRARSASRPSSGFTFRYAPAMRYMRQLVADGFVGTPFIFNGYEQNSQWLDPMNPLRQVDPARRSERAARVVARGLRRADHRHLAPAGRQRPRRRWSARCATSSPNAWCAPPG